MTFARQRLSSPLDSLIVVFTKLPQRPRKSLENSLNHSYLRVMLKKSSPEPRFKYRSHEPVSTSATNSGNNVKTKAEQRMRESTQERYPAVAH